MSFSIHLQESQIKAIKIRNKIWWKKNSSSDIRPELLEQQPVKMVRKEVQFRAQSAPAGRKGLHPQYKLPAEPVVLIDDLKANNYTFPSFL